MAKSFMTQGLFAKGLKLLFCARAEARLLQDFGQAQLVPLAVTLVRHAVHHLTHQVHPQTAYRSVLKA